MAKRQRQYTPIYFQDLCGQANVHSALVIKPEKFWDNKKAQLSTGTTKFEIQWIPYEQLVRFVDVTQIPKELGGAYPYNHSEWLQARIVSHFCHCYCQLFLGAGALDLEGHQHFEGSRRAEETLRK